MVKNVHVFLFDNYVTKLSYEIPTSVLSDIDKKLPGNVRYMLVIERLQEEYSLQSVLCFQQS
jgi:hypothetical protein